MILDVIRLCCDNVIFVGSTSRLLNRCSFGGFSSHSLTDSLGNPDPRNRTSVGLTAEPHIKPRKKKHHTNADNDNDSNVQIERRISVRQTENAFRFKEIVVRKCSKYMHLVTLSQTPTKNAFNPKVSFQAVKSPSTAKGYLGRNFIEALSFIMPKTGNPRFSDHYNLVVNNMRSSFCLYYHSDDQRLYGHEFQYFNMACVQEKHWLPWVCYSCQGC